MTNLLFLRPYLFLFIIPIIIIFFLSLKRKKNEQNHISQNLLSFLTKRNITTSWLTPSTLLFSLALLLIIALAGPAIPQPPPLSMQDANLIIILGMDKTMYADDIKPSRLSVTKEKISELLTRNASAKIAMIAFSGSAHIISPFTSDSKTLKYFLDSLNPDVMPQSGSNILDAVKLATSMATQLPSHNKIRLLLITDQITNIQSEKLIQLMQPLGWPLDIVFVGTQTGSVIQLPKGELLRTTSGQLVVAKTPITALANTAKKIKSNIIDIHNLDGYSMPSINSEAAIPQIDLISYHELGYFLLLPALFISILFRRGSIVVIFLLFSMPHTSYAKNTAMELYTQGKYEDASHIFQDFIWKGNAMYRAGKYNEAIFFYEKTNSDISNYNKGNALAHIGKIKEAINAYDDAIKLNSSLTVAIDNKKILTSWLDKKNQNEIFDKKTIDELKNNSNNIEESLSFLKELPENSGEFMKKRLQQQSDKTK